MNLQAVSSWRPAALPPRIGPREFTERFTHEHLAASPRSHLSPRGGVVKPVCLTSGVSPTCGTERSIRVEPRSPIVLPELTIRWHSPLPYQENLKVNRLDPGRDCPTHGKSVRLPD
ncbi:hypothetical protein R1flu_013967 [Riccia fluitans]|uniref:Uncharacterized protein n=1 Tax=Riccia fluitans TaxID=41844 RepID=A0ABD1YES4_9MARC